jgi:hypothetical protein
VCTDVHLQSNDESVVVKERSILGLILIYIFRIGEKNVEAILTRTIQLVASMFLNVNINTIKLIKQDREPKITARTDQHTVSIWQTRKIDVHKTEKTEILHVERRISKCVTSSTPAVKETRLSRLPSQPFLSR